MGQEREFLEDHRHLFLPEPAQSLGAEARDILAVDQDFPGGGFDQAVQVADQGGFAGPRQPHDDGDLAGLHLDVDVLQPEDMGVFFKQRRLVHACLDMGDHVAIAGAEDLVEPFQGNLGRHCSPRCLSTRFSGGL